MTTFSEDLEGFENAKEPAKLKTEKVPNLLNSQISTITNNLNSKFKETESTLNLTETLRYKTAEILNRPNNQELEMDFRATSLAYHTNFSFYNPQLMQAYQDYLNAYQQKTSLYNLKEDKNYRIKLIIYNSESETKQVKILDTLKSLDLSTCIAQLPNGKIFCFGNNYYPYSGFTVLIDLNGSDEVLASGTPCSYSSCIYFNNCVYCFGGFNDKGEVLTLSSKFDLDRKRWIQLTPMPNSDYCCNSILFDGNILISGFKRNLLLYSIDIDSFSTISYGFAAEKKKILVNAERMYLIECGKDGSIYESEIGSYTNWRRIANSKIDLPFQVYCLYNKGGICISGWKHQEPFNCKLKYYRFDLNKISISKLF